MDGEMAYWRGVSRLGPLSIVGHLHPIDASLAHGLVARMFFREGSLPVPEDIPRGNSDAVAKVADLESWKVLVAVKLGADVLPAHKNCAVVSDTIRI